MGAPRARYSQATGGKQGRAPLSRCHHLPVFGIDFHGSLGGRSPGAMPGLLFAGPLSWPQIHTDKPRADCQQDEADAHSPKSRGRQQLFNSDQRGERGNPAQIHNRDSE